MVAAPVSFNGCSIGVAPYAIQSIEGLVGSPELRTSDLALVSRSGVIAGVDRYSGRTITITVNIYASSDAAFATAVNTFTTAFASPQPAPLPLTFTIPAVAGGNAARLNVRPRKWVLPQPFTWFAQAGFAVVELYATDPLIYSDTESSAIINLASGAAGGIFNATFDYTFGGAVSYGSATLTNAGSVLAPVTIRINGPVTNPTVRNVTTGQSLVFTVTLDAGTYLLVDTTARTVMLNGTADRYSYLTTPQWWGLQPGANEIRYFADTTTGSNVVITWRSAWI